MTDSHDGQSAVHDWLGQFEQALQARDINAVLDLFEPDCFWRDLVAFSWNIVTVEGHDGIRGLLEDTLTATAPHEFRPVDTMAATTTPSGVQQGWFEFSTATGRVVSLVRLRYGKAWTLLTALRELTGFEEPVGTRRPFGADHGALTDRQTWLEKIRHEKESLGFTEQPYALVVGGGQGGIALGARLRQLGVPALIIDRHENPGDQWRSRYKSLCLHDPVWYDHLPYLDFPANWPIYTPKDKIGDWLEMYVKIMELNYWGSTECKSASWNVETGSWDVVVRRHGNDLVLHPKQVILATGLAGKANVPIIPGQETFRGEQQHSSQHTGPDAYANRRVVVVGSNNSAHDIAAALWEVGADVTMLQRSSSLVVRSDTLRDFSQAPLYSEAAIAAGITTEQADLTSASVPYRLMADFQIPLWDKIREHDKDFYEALERAGFLLDFGTDGSGLWLKYLSQGGGYYVDVGASDLVISGEIKLRSSANIERLTETGVLLAGGEELPADLVVYATGYGPMNQWIADIFSPEVSDRVGTVWGIGSERPGDAGPWEGELRNMWKPTAQEGFWIHAGNLHQSRSYSLYLALQIKARYEGLPVHVYGGADVAAHEPA
ncbi:NAD(P)/FAD-dependent oxidoreductase [soil metagenome]